MQYPGRKADKIVHCLFSLFIIVVLLLKAQLLAQMQLSPLSQLGGIELLKACSC